MTKQPLMGKKICFAGAGAMAEAIMRGLIATGAAKPEQICVLNRSNQSALISLQERYGVQPALTETERNKRLTEADIVLLAMKPKDAPSALAAMKSQLSPVALIVSVIASLPLRAMKQALGPDALLVRTMPNTSSTIGFGTTGLCFSDNVNEAQRMSALALFEAVGEAIIVEEDKIDAVTAISGSGPAYFYYMMEAMIAAGVKLGFDEETAKQLTTQTILGAANMVKQTGESPAVLRENVTSPGGITQAALASLGKDRVADAMERAIQRGTERAREIERELFD